MPLSRSPLAWQADRSVGQDRSPVVQSVETHSRFEFISFKWIQFEKMTDLCCCALWDERFKVQNEGSKGWHVTREWQVGRLVIQHLHIEPLKKSLWALPSLNQEKSRLVIKGFKEYTFRFTYIEWQLFCEAQILWTQVRVPNTELSGSCPSQSGAAPALNGLYLGPASKPASQQWKWSKYYNIVLYA